MPNENQKRITELERWLGYVEEKATTGYWYERGCQECLKLNVESYPHLLARLDKARKTAEKSKIEKDVERYLSYIKDKIDVYWYSKGETKVLEGIKRLKEEFNDTSAFEADLASLRQEYHDLFRKRICGEYDGPIYQLYGGSGYIDPGCWKEGDVVENQQFGIDKGEPRYLYVLHKKSINYQKKTSLYYDNYSCYAYCRPATEEEAAPLKARNEKRKREKNALEDLEYVRNTIWKTGEYPKGLFAWPDGQEIINRIDNEGSGNCFVISEDYIWYINKTGDWDHRECCNIETPRGGALGWRMKYSGVISALLTIIAENLPSKPA